MSNSHEARVARYGKAIWEASRADEGTISFTGANHVARAVMAVADAEIAQVQEEAEGWSESSAEAFGAWHEALSRAKAAEAAIARVLELVDAYEAIQPSRPTWKSVVKNIRTALGDRDA